MPKRNTYIVEFTSPWSARHVVVAPSLQAAVTEAMRVEGISFKVSVQAHKADHVRRVN